MRGRWESAGAACRSPSGSETGVHGMVISMLATLLKRLGVVCLAFVVVWHVTQLSAPRWGKAIVHVSQTSHTVVSIDHADYLVRSAMESPVVCNLEPGPHLIQVWEAGKLKDEHRINVVAGKEVVISTIERPAGERVGTDPRPVASGGLAARIRPDRPAAVAN